MKKVSMRMLLVVGLAVLAFALTAVFLTGLQRTVPVVVAATYLEAGSVLSESVLEVRNVHSSAVLAGAVQDPADLVGKILQVQRVPGDQITADMAGDRGTSAVAQGLAPDHRAIAINVTRATGVLGVLRPGDRVDVVATVEESGAGTAGRGSAVSAVVVRDVRVLVVPQAFRYREVPITEDNPEGVMSGDQYGGRQAEQNTVVLDVPLFAVEVTAGYTDTLTQEWVPPTTMSPVELLTLLNTKATLHLVLRPPDATDVTVPPTALSALLSALRVQAGTLPGREARP